MCKPSDSKTSRVPCKCAFETELQKMHNYQMHYFIYNYHILGHDMIKVAYYVYVLSCKIVYFKDVL